MSEKEFELYLSLLGRFLRLKPGQRSEIADELRDHLEERLGELSAEGFSRDDAIRRALEEFGDAAELATHFSHLARRRRRRFLMRIAYSSIGAAAAVILIAFAMWPAIPQVDMPPRAVAQQDENSEGDFVGQDPPATAQSNVPVKPKDESHAVVEAKLAKRLEQINFEDVPLKDALEAISEQIEVDILINEASLEDEGITLDAPVNLSLKHTAVSAATALELIFERAAGRNKLAYKIRDGFIYVQTAIASDEDMEIEVYNVRDLLEGMAPIQRTVYNMGGGFGGVGAGFFQIADSAIKQPDSGKGRAGVGGRQSRGIGSVGGVPQHPRIVDISPGEGLIRVIQSHTSGPWDGTVGNGGSIEQFKGLLVVRHTQAQHREIKEFLEMLRAADKERPAKK